MATNKQASAYAKRIVELEAEVARLRQLHDDHCSMGCDLAERQERPQETYRWCVKHDDMTYVCGCDPAPAPQPDAPEGK